MGGSFGFYGELFRHTTKTRILPIQHVTFPVQETKNQETAEKSENPDFIKVIRGVGFIKKWILLCYHLRNVPQGALRTSSGACGSSASLVGSATRS